MLTMLLKGFLLGLATGPACLATCFPVLLPVVIGDINAGSPGLKPLTPVSNRIYSWRIMAHFLAGRAASYVVMGMIMGFLGGRMGGLGYKLAMGASFCMAILMIAYGLGANIGRFRPCHVFVRWAGKPQLPFALGALTGLNVCPPFLLAMTTVLADGQSLPVGGIFFLAFFVASSLYMLPAGMGRIFSYFGSAAANTARVAAVFVGLFFLISSGMNFWRMLNGGGLS
jgi:hypothetical protein